MGIKQTISKNKRMFVFFLGVFLLLLLIVIKLFFLQIKDTAYYRARADAALGLTISQPAPRGEILDRYGRPIVTNQMGNFVVFEPDKDKRKQQNRALLLLLKQEPRPELANVLVTERERLIKTYEIDEAFSESEQQLLLKVYADFEKRGEIPYTLLQETSLETVVTIKEHPGEFSGFTAEERPIRKYLYPTSCVHLLGTVGRLSRAEYETLKHQGYEQNDMVGKSGVEKAFEDYLRGEKGTICAPKYKGSPQEQLIEEKEAVPGNTVMLTIDLSLQMEAEQALKRAVEQKNKSGKNGGAVVVMETFSGEILACASYPAYDLSSYHKQYNKLLNDSGRPLFHRAVSGLYEPGSTFKPITAIAAMESGSLTAEERIFTKGKYSFLNTAFQCNIYKKSKRTHGTINVSEALGVSCNYFFYEIANRIGIAPIAETAKQFGLGDKTGIELLEETKGNIASKENRIAAGGSWYPGDTLQAAIGQSDNLFTPLALASYTSTLANGGVGYKATLLKSVKSPGDHTVLYTATPQPNRQVTVSDNTLSAVKEGMKQVTEIGGTASAAFSQFPISVAGKTGSAEVRGGTNGLFICYCPAEAPQIAVSVVLEKGDSGAAASKVAKEILESYFQNKP